MATHAQLPVLQRRTVLGAFLASAFSPCWAEGAWPNRLVKFVNWSNPGGNLDIVGRILADAAARKWSQTVITDNRIGATGMIATDYVAKSRPDGYTVLITSSTGQLTNSLTHLKLPYDPVKDFEPISLLVAGNVGLMAAGNAPFSNLKELVEYAKKSSRPLTYGTPGIGTSAHLYGEALSRQAGIEMIHVPYKGGELGALNDIMGGMLDLTLISQGNAKTQSAGGRLKILAMSGPQRTKGLPNVPTFEEQGFKGFGLAGWIAAYVPAATPKPVVAKIAGTFRETLLQPEISQRLDELGYEVIAGRPEELRSFYQKEYARFAELVKNAGIVPE